MGTPAPFIPLKPLPIKDRASIVFLEYGELDVLDSAFVLVDKNGVRVQIPVGGVVCLMLEPGTRGAEPPHLIPHMLRQVCSPHARG